MQNHFKKKYQTEILPEIYFWNFAFGPMEIKKGKNKLNKSQMLVNKIGI